MLYGANTRKVIRKASINTAIQMLSDMVNQASKLDTPKIKSD